MTKIAPDESRLGSNVRVRREELNFSQEFLASHMQQRGFPKWSQATVWSIERGQRPIRLSEGAIIADLLGVSIGDLVDGSYEPPENALGLAVTVLEDYQSSLRKRRTGR